MKYVLKIPLVKIKTKSMRVRNNFYKIVICIYTERYTVLFHLAEECFREQVFFLSLFDEGKVFRDIKKVCIL